MIGIDLKNEKNAIRKIHKFFHTVFIFVIVVTTSPLTTVSSVDETVLPLLVAGTTVSVIVFVNLEHKQKYSVNFFFFFFSNEGNRKSRLYAQKRMFVYDGREEEEEEKKYERF